MTLKVGIFGAGHGGVTAADLTRQGHEITLYQSPESKNDLTLLREADEVILNGERVTFRGFTHMQG